MLISRLTLIAALGFTAAAYPAGRSDDTGFDASMALRPGGTSSQGPGEHDSSQSSSRTAQRPPNLHPSKRDGPHPPPVNPSAGPGAHRVGNGGNGAPSDSMRLPPGAKPFDGQPGQSYKRHEGHGAEPHQGPPDGTPSGVLSEPDRTRPSYGDHSDAPERPDRGQSGRTKDGHDGHHHLRDHKKPSKDGQSRDGKDGKDGRERPSGRSSMPGEPSPATKAPVTATFTSTPSKSAESTVSVGPAPSASLKPDDLTGSVSQETGF